MMMVMMMLLLLVVVVVRVVERGGDGVVRVVVVVAGQRGALVAGLSPCAGTALSRRAAQDSIGETRPRLNRLGRPNPKAGRYTDYEHHGVLDDEDDEAGFVVDVSSVLARARYGVGLAVVVEPAALPRVAVEVLVEVARYHHGGGNGVENTEHADLHHQALQLVNLRRIGRAHV